ncbi:AP2/ERF domain-containing protein PFD0985w-like [Colias croceus]|uniref:AP2/ERF domain-containing protein PFD0985w-like n=1 Tax=Colias crocea TaxID=72248 RepID=UPI001E27B1FF|nr:AP2/ERF domain-containing protein PFD0985w-like [Colias croceus]
MAPIRYSLHYEDYSEHLMSRFGKLLQMQALVDMTLMCSSHTLRVHKAVLAASSAYFQDVLQKQTGEPLIILKMRFGVMKCLVEFMYCGKTQCPEENLDELVSAAQFLKIKGLSKVTKEGLGITSTSELPVFTPPVVINRPPQSLIDLHSQDNVDKALNSIPTTIPTGENRTTANDTVVRIPFDIENKGINGGDFDLRSVRPRRGRPSFRSGAWDGSGVLGRAAERALLRREQDSRKAIHHLKSLQSRQMQDYMDRTLSQAVNSICEPESNSNSYLNMDSDLMYMDQTTSSNVLDPTISFSKENSLGNETITSSYTTTTSDTNKNNNEISSAMSQYVNALKSAGLPTDLPILFESGDGSYINVNEQVLLDMVQSSEIQYEVIEQPNIIEKVADPSEIKSIDDLSKSIERGEMLIGSNNYTSNSNFDKNNIGHDDAINTLNALLPDGLESFNEQQNYVVLDSGLRNGTNSIDNESTNDFSCIENDMQYFTKSMSEDVKKYYQDQQLNDHRGVDQLCPVSSSLDTSFSMSLLDTKGSQLGEGMSQQYNPLSSERNEDCYDFSLQLTESTHFKEDEIDCLISAPKQSNDTDRFNHNERTQEQDEIMKDLMDLESNINDVQNDSSEINIEQNNSNNNVDFENMKCVFNEENRETNTAIDSISDKNEFTGTIPADLEWDKDTIEDNIESLPLKNDEMNSGNDPETLKRATNEWTDKNTAEEERRDICPTLDENIPFAVGLLPLKAQKQREGSDICKKRMNEDDLSSVDAKCLKRKVKHKIM